MPRPVSFKNGISTGAINTEMFDFGMPDPTRWHVYFNDFDTFAAGDWTITTTEAGAGSATEALGNADGGVLVITNDAADNDLDFFQLVGESFKFEAGKKLIFKMRFKVSDATQADFYCGLLITDTTALDVTDGVFFRSDDGDTNIDFDVEKDNTATTVVAGTAADDTYMTLGFVYDGSPISSSYSGVSYFVNGVKKGTSVNTNIPNDEELAVSFGIQNGEAVAKIMTIDYIFVAKER